MNQQVAFQRGVVIKTFSAHSARIGFLPSVYPDVSHHVLAAVEGFPTLAAVKRFLPRVDPHVRLQRAGGAETFPTNAADFRFHVRCQVILKTLLTLEALPAHAADLLRVHLQVVHQRDVSMERLPADFTANLRFCFFTWVQFQHHRTMRLPFPPVLVAVFALRLPAARPLLTAVVFLHHRKAGVRSAFNFSLRLRRGSARERICFILVQLIIHTRRSDDDLVGVLLLRLLLLAFLSLWRLLVQCGAPLLLTVFFLVLVRREVL